MTSAVEAGQPLPFRANEQRPHPRAAGTWTAGSWRPPWRASRHLGGHDPARPARAGGGWALRARLRRGAAALAGLGSFAQREATAPARKAALGRRAAALVRPGQILLIDAGTTNVAIAAALPERQGLTVATNAPAVATALLGREGIEALLLGGRLDHRAGGAVGARTVRDVQGLQADLCFVGACAVDARAGVAGFDAEEAALKQAMVEASGGVAVAATSEKLGTAAALPRRPRLGADRPRGRGRRAGRGSGRAPRVRRARPRRRP